MFERQLFQTLRDGIAEYISKPRRVERIFTDQGLTDTEAAKIRDYFQRLPPTVIHGYPREDSKFPLVAVILGAEGETDLFLDNTGGVLDADEAARLGEEDLEGGFIRTSGYDAEYMIMVVTDQPDITLSYYQIVKDIFTRQRDDLIKNGALGMRFSGNDMHPSDMYMPAYMFVRKFNVTVRYEARLVEDPGERGTRVDGIFVDDGSEPVGVETLVTVITGQEE